jgi:hypothetical protein
MDATRANVLTRSNDYNRQNKPAKQAHLRKNAALGGETKTFLVQAHSGRIAERELS